jgi:hypothetical protein
MTFPPYSIFCVTSPHLHLNGTFSRDSQRGVLKLLGFGLSELWQLITPYSSLQLGWGMQETCIFPWELSKGVLHSTYTHRSRVDSQLLVVGSQTVNLTPDPSFAHNLCSRCPNGSCEAICNIYDSRPFQRYKEHLKVRCFNPCNWALNFQEFRRTPKSPFRECECHPHTPSKWSCDKNTQHLQNQKRYCELKTLH